MASHAIPIGQRIRDLRVARGMTQEKLARMSSVDIKTIYRTERGEDAMRLETLLDIATALEVSLDEVCAPDSPDAEAQGGESEGHGNLVLRRVERASSLYALADASEHYSWSFQVDPDEETADAIREVMEIVRRATHGAERAADEADALERAFGLEREAVAGIERLLSSD
jgi:transcriptional regulator with XRE-family HTH domain